VSEIPASLDKCDALQYYTKTVISNTKKRRKGVPYKGPKPELDSVNVGLFERLMAISWHVIEMGAPKFGRKFFLR